MKFMEKYAAWITAALLGIIAITFSALFFVTKNDLKALESATAFLYGNKEVRLVAFTGEDDPATTEIDERTKILDELYTTTKSIKTLDGLMQTDKNNFDGTIHAEYGLYLTKVKNTLTGSFVEAPMGKHWAIKTPTYYSDAKQFKYNASNFKTWTIGYESTWNGTEDVVDKTKPYYGTDTLVGATGLHLISNQQIFVFELIDSIW